MASFKNLISNTSAQISSGGTITGDLIINGDLQVDGGGSLSFDEIIEGTSVIDIDSTTALVVRKNGASGDVLIVDTDNSRVGIGGTPHVNSTLNVKNSSGTAFLYITSANDFDSAIVLEEASTAKWIIGNDGNDSDKLKFGTGGGWGTETRMTLDSSGNLGIGDSPSYSLHVSSTDSAILLIGSTQGRVILQDSGATSNHQAFDIVSVSDKLNFRRLNDARSGVNATVMTFDSDNVGINNDSPDSKLTISDATNDNLRIGTRGGNMNIHSVTDAGASSPLAFEGSEFQFITGDATFAGNVIVGSTISTSSDTSLQIGDSGDTHLRIGEDSNSNARMTWDASENSLEFHLISSGTSRSDVLVLDNTGFVGINDNSPEARFTIAPDTVGTTSLGGRSINYGLNINTTSGRSGVTVKPLNNYAVGDDNAGFQWLYPFDDGGDGNFKAFRVSEGATLVDKFYATRDGQGYFASNVTSDGNLTLRSDSGGNIYFTEADGTNDEMMIGYDQANQRLRFRSNAHSLDRMLVTKTGQVGINIVPETTLNVASPVSSSVTTFPTLRLTSQTETADWDAGDVNGVFEFYTADTSGNAPYVNAFIKSINEQENGTLPSGSLSFGTATYNAVSGAVERMRIDSSGNVGIGTTSPLDGGGSKTVLTISDDTQSVLVFEDTGYESSGDGLGMFAYNDGTLTYRTASRSGTDWSGSTNRLVIDAFSSISLSNNDSGTANTIFGKNAGYNLDAGSNYNVFIGQNVSDASMNDATFNTGIGYEALSELTSGDYNVSIGAYASQSNTNSSFNTVLGTFGLQKNINGEHNTALGYTAGKFSPAGAANVTSPDQCVIIGSLTEFSSATPLNQIVIGYNADGLADNTVTLGNSSITDVYMAQDSGATVHAGGARIGSPTVTTFATNIKASQDVLSLEADGTGGPQLRMTDTSSSSNDDTFGLIDFSAKDAGGNQIVMNRILNKVTDNNASSTDSELSIYAMNNDTLTETVRIGSGILHLPQGQLKFPASQNASSDANTLDDYEEGEHTVTVTCSTSGTLTVTSDRPLSYVKIGSMVTINGQLSVSSLSSPVGHLQISLPFTIGSGTGLSKRCSGSVTIYNTSGLNMNDFAVLGIEGENFFRVYASDGTALTEDSANAMTATSQIAVDLTYFV